MSGSSAQTQPGGPKLSFSTDLGFRHHWDRLIKFAARHGAERIVFWGNYTVAGFTEPCLYPKHPKLLDETERARREKIRESFRHAVELTQQAGMDLWYCYNVLMLPPGDVQSVCPELFNEHGEVDFTKDAVYQFMCDQLDEVLEIAPDLVGIEMWIMECAAVCLSYLEHQSAPKEQIVQRILSTVHDYCRRRGLRLSVDLHTAGGDRALLEAILSAAQAHPEVIVSADNTIGDFHMCLPFNEHLVRASKTNPVIVRFDVNGEFWGRNFIPTGALSYYAEHIEQARALNPLYIDGRVATGLDAYSPHANILPNRRRFYPAFRQIQQDSPLIEPTDHDHFDDSGGLRSDVFLRRSKNPVDVCSFDTLGGFNAEFFARRVKDPTVEPLEAVRDFLKGEYGQDLDDLARALVEVEEVTRAVLYADRSYFNLVSSLVDVNNAAHFALDVHLTTPAGDPFPPPEGLPHAPAGFPDSRYAFAGWPAPIGHRASGVHAMIAEKQAAAAKAEDLLARVGKAAAVLDEENRRFLVRQFEDLLYYASAASVQLEAMAHYFHLLLRKRQDGIPDRERLAELLGEMESLAAEWEARYPDHRYMFDQILRGWHRKMAVELEQHAAE